MGLLSKDLEIRLGIFLLQSIKLAYELSDGRVRPPADRFPVLLLRVQGRRTGTLRTVALTYVAEGDRLAVIGSRGGDDRPPAWLLNLEANPVAEVQVGRHRWPVHARVAEGSERERLWRGANRFGPYDHYQSRTQRRIPVVVLEPQHGDERQPEP